MTVRDFTGRPLRPYTRPAVAGTSHVVVQGESIGSIADLYGFYWGTIWNDPANAGLREQRADPNVLYPGDVVHVPEKGAKVVPAATGRTHRFRLKGVPSMFRLRILRDDGSPRAGVSYRVIIDGAVVQSGVLGDDAMLAFPVSPRARTATLVFGEGAAAEEYSLRFGHLDPITTVSGVKARLNNLGYDAGPEDGPWDESATAALKRFQEALGQMEPSGELDDDTRAALQRAHDPSS